MAQSSWFRIASWSALGVAFAAVSLRWWFASAAWMPPVVAAHFPPGGLSAGQRVAGFAVEMIPFAAAFYTVMALNAICARYHRRELFGPHIGTAYRSLGRGLLLLGVAHALYITLMTAALSLTSASGQIVVSLGLSLADLYLLIVGGAATMLGHVMEEAHRLQQENSEFV
jgi:hypothetical protein